MVRDPIKSGRGIGEDEREAEAVEECPDCSRDVPLKAASCPFCGEPMNEGMGYQKSRSGNQPGDTDERWWSRVHLLIIKVTGGTRLEAIAKANAAADLYIDNTESTGRNPEILADSTDAIEEAEKGGWGMVPEVLGPGHPSDDKNIRSDGGDLLSLIEKRNAFAPMDPPNRTVSVIDEDGNRLSDKQALVRETGDSTDDVWFVQGIAYDLPASYTEEMLAGSSRKETRKSDSGEKQESRNKLSRRQHCEQCGETTLHVESGTKTVDTQTGETEVPAVECTRCSNRVLE
jgi:hypothetical protein